MDPVWSKYSCGLARVVFEQPTQPFTALYRAVILAYWSGWRTKQDVALPLVIALPMVMVHIFVEHLSQGVFAEQNQLR